jgi:WD40 repeat protein
LATVSGDGTACLWDTDSQSLLTQFRVGLLGVVDAAFSAEGRRLIIGSDGVKIWDTQLRRELVRLSGGKSDLFQSVAMTPDHQTVIAVGDDGQVRLWRAPSWEEIAAVEAL